MSLAFSLILFFVIQSILAGLEVQLLSERVVESRLEHDMEEVVSSLYIRSNGQFQVNWQRVPSIYRRLMSGHYFVIQTPRGWIYSRSLKGNSLPQLPLGFHHGIEGPQSFSLSVYTQKFNFYGHEMQIHIAEETSLVSQTVLAFQNHLLPIFVAMVLLLLGFQMWIIRSSLKPLVNLRSEILRLERGEIQKLVNEGPTEIQPMIDEVNQLLQLQMQRLQRSRHALGNMAHALKTPLTLMTQLLDQDVESNKERLKQQLGVIQERIDRDLARARMAGQVHGGIWPEPVKDIEDLVATLNMIYRDQANITLDIDGLIRIPADREDMMEILGNLLDNACKWAKAEVRCKIWCQQGLHLCIEDDGKGMSSENMRNILKRGVRFDESVAGHGLGMSIVQEVVHAYDGSIELNLSDELGGLKVHITLFAMD
ncbi:MAG: sensor histidine kinase [Mariprofundaceae bacterium]|nr:sensor histidine kinase [Mariprofundaceae bacterium]